MPHALKLEIQLPDDVPAWLDQFRFWLDLKVRLYETDANGHMSQLTYFAYQELGSTEYWAHLGFPELVGSQAELSMFMGEQYCRFVSEVGYGEPVRLGVRCAHLGRSSLRLEYAFCHTGRRLIAAGASGLVLVEVATRRPVPLFDGLRQAIERLERVTGS